MDRAAQDFRIDEDLDPQDQVKIEELLCDLRRLRERYCSGCGAAICGHEALMSLTMGFKDAPQCWACLADTLGYEKEALRDHIFAYITHRSCHYEGWRWATREEGFEPDKPPGCLWPVSSTQSKQEWKVPKPATGEVPVSGMEHDSEWDAGDLGCGDLVLELRIRMKTMRPGQILKLKATDPGAPTDLPSWCRVTGNTLLAFQHPYYWIKRKD
jgi:tRNA 2-thiouridine synthesizing protein A